MPLRPSLAELLITNLRLLHLDQFDDWPNITPRVYSLSKEGPLQNQKQRIYCTEWALYRLIELWAPHEATYKLRPYFPPLEPIQSLNLRSALFRILAELKKNGLLGRETVLRKSMLDDCKGEKFLEILVVFSTLVVNKAVVSSHANVLKSIAMKIVTSNTNPSPKLVAESIIPLTIAFKKSISSEVKRKCQVRDNCTAFSQFLDAKSLQLSQRETASRSKPLQPIPMEVSLKVEREVAQNWLGNNKWPQLLVCGENKTKDWALEQPFEQLWPKALRGDTLEMSLETESLLLDMETRVDQQKKMVQKWQHFHQDMVRRLEGYQKVQVAPAIQEKQQPLSKFDFTLHQTLHLNNMSSSSQPYKPPRVTAIDNIIAEMEAELTTSYRPSSIEKLPFSYQSYSPFTNQHSTSQRTSQHITQRLPLSSSDNSNSNIHHAPATNHNPILNSRPATINENNHNRRISLSSTAVPLSRIFSPAKPMNQSNGLGHARLPPPISLQVNPNPIPISHDQNRNWARPSASSSGTSTPVSDDNSSTPEVKQQDTIEFEANRIVDSIMKASTTPMPEKLSLADRTRLSMANTSTTTTAAAATATIRLFSPNNEMSTATTVIAAGPSIEDRRVSLLERTQQSMSHLASISKSTSRKSLILQKRQSIVYPVNQFETPGRPRPDAVGNATPTMDNSLLPEEAEYASVFKSRPRLKSSPAPTPDIHDLPQHLADLQEEEDDDYNDYDADDSFMRSSPLRGRG